MSGQVEIEGELGREIFGMEVVGDDLRGHAVQLTQMRHGLVEGAVLDQVLQIADVVADDHGGALCHRDGVLKLGADRQHLPPGRSRQWQRLGGITA